jgi:dTMP kinase
MKKNLFIALEGIDGSGKSTQLKLLAQHFKSIGHQVITTCEPTDGPIGKLIRDIFNHRVEADHRVIAGLFIADRLDHLLNKETGILKKLEEGFTVISDRYYFSSYAYQGAHMPLDWVIQANSLSAELLRPDLNVFIDISIETSMQRIQQGRSSVELFETRENLELVKSTFFKSFELLKNEEHIFITDGDRSPELVAADIWSEIMLKFETALD